MIQAQDGHSHMGGDGHSHGRDMQLDSRHSLMADSLGCRWRKQNKTTKQNTEQKFSLMPSVWPQWLEELAQKLEKMQKWGFGVSRGSWTSVLNCACGNSEIQIIHAAAGDKQLSREPRSHHYTELTAKDSLALQSQYA